MPLKDKNPSTYKIFSNKWVASIIIGALGIFLAWSGGYSTMWPAFSGANQLIASIVMLTMAIWVKRKLNPRYVMSVVLPAAFLWVTVTVALIWYEIVIIPAFLANPAKPANIVTGIIVGLINLFMLILNFVMIKSFLKNWKLKPSTA